MRGMTLCFLSDPLQSLAEAVRVLRPGGSLLIGFVPSDSTWGKACAQKAAEGNPFYASVTFRSTKEVAELVTRAGVIVTGSASCLQESAESSGVDFSDPCEGIVPDAGFVVMRVTPLQSGKF